MWCESIFFLKNVGLGMLRFSLGVLAVFMVSGFGGGYAAALTTGDINGDGKVDLVEAIYALQVAAGAPTPPADCHGDIDGTAYIDNCGDCVEGNTGNVACSQDCNGDWGGAAYYDFCNTCVGGATGLTECSDPGSDPVSIKIYPEHVGVFTSQAAQQFVVFSIKSNGYHANITSQVSCGSSDETIVSLDQNNIATIVNGVTSGRVTVSCTNGTLADSTTLTVVNVNTIGGWGVDVTQWAGSWPNDADDTIRPEGQEVYLNNVVFSENELTWDTVPEVTPYPTFDTGINSLIAFVSSNDNGQIFTLNSWDFLTNSTHLKSISGGNDDCWRGVLIHSICDKTPGVCNGRYRSNVYFSGSDSWGSECWPVSE